MAWGLPSGRGCHGADPGRPWLCLTQVLSPVSNVTEDNHLRLVEMCNNHPMFQFLFDESGMLLAANKRALYNMRGAWQRACMHAWVGAGECACAGPWKAMPCMARCLPVPPTRPSVAAPPADAHATCGACPPRRAPGVVRALQPSELPGDWGVRWQQRAGGNVRRGDGRHLCAEPALLPVSAASMEQAAPREISLGVVRDVAGGGPRQPAEGGARLRAKHLAGQGREEEVRGLPARLAAALHAPPRGPGPTQCL